MTSLTVELRNLSQELKALNVRQQMSIDLLRQSRLDQRIDRYENDLRPVRERIAALEIEEQKLHQLMTRESLIAQTAQTSTVNREATMQQFKGQLAVRLQAVLDEKERLRKVETDQGASLDIYQKLNIEAEQKIQQAEEKLRELEKIKPNGPNGPEIKQ
jgi:DNA repair exonuclease SbcCD ATPase subunit